MKKELLDLKEREKEILTRLAEMGLVEYVPGKKLKLTPQALIAWDKSMDQLLSMPEYYELGFSVKEDPNIPIDDKEGLIYQVVIHHMLSGEFVSDFDAVDEEMKELVAVLSKIFRLSRKPFDIKKRLHPTVTGVG